MLGRISERFCKTDAQGRKIGASPTGEYRFNLTVTDALGRSHSAAITATVTDTLPPVAVAKVTSVYQADRDRQLICSTEPDAPIRCGNGNTPGAPDTSNTVQGPGTTVRLSGRDSKTNVDGSLTYSWEQTCTDSSSGRVVRVECPVAVTLRSATSATPSFTAPDQEIDLWFTLTVTDSDGNRDSDRLHVRIEDASPETFRIPPQAHAFVTYPAGAEAFLESARVTLDGSGSNDILDNGRIVTYAWEQIDASGNVISDPPGTLSNANRSRATFLTPTNLAADATYRFRLTVTDNIDLTDTAEVSVRVKAVVAIPAADAGEGQTVAEGEIVTLTGSSRNFGDNATLTYVWTYRGDRPGTPSLTDLSALAAQEITFTAPSGLTRDAYYQFTLTVSGGGRSASDTVPVTVTAVNKRPVADAGPDQTVEWGSRVRLNSVDSLNPYGADPLRYSWRQTSGTPAVELDAPSISVPDFVLPSQPLNVGTAASNALTFELTVTDREGVTDTDTVIVSVTNRHPTAEAGDDQNVAWNDSVTLDGSDSFDPRNDGVSANFHKPLQYRWRQKSGAPAVTLRDPNNVQTSFHLPGWWRVLHGDNVTLVFELTVTDVRGAEAEAEVSVSVSWRGAGGSGAGGNGGPDSSPPPEPQAPVAPTAKAGLDLTGAPGESVTLQGKGSTNPYGRWHQMVHRWTQLSGPTVALSDATKGNPSFTMPEDASDGATLEFELTVTDQWGQSDSDAMIVTVVVSETVRPTACAGPDLTGAPGDEVTLQGKCSVNPYGRWHQMTYQWTQLSGPAATLTHPRKTQPAGKFADPRFILPADAQDGSTLEFQLTVTDQEGQSDSDTMIVTVAAPEPVRPTAKAGPDLAGAPGESVTLQGKGSVNPYGRWHQMTYQWTQLSGPAVTLTHPRKTQPAGKFADPSFTIPADAAGGTTLEFQLTVTDQEGESDSDTMVVTVTGAEPENTPPTASIDAAQVATAEAGETVELQGAGNDAETAVGSLTFAWSQVGATPTVSIASATTATASFTAPDVTEATELTFRLTVTDEGGLSATAETTIAISPSPESANTPPTASIDAAQVTSAEAGETVELQGTGGDAETAAGSLTFAWSQVGGTPTVSIAGATTATASFTAPDVTAETSLTFRLTVTDEGGLSATAETTVAISPLPEPEPNRAPTFDANIDTVLTVAENSAAGTNVGLPITATDSDGDTPTYSLSGSDAVSFEIDAATGQMTTIDGVVYDYEARQTYAVTVTAEDPEGASASISVTVSLTDVEETLPVTACFTDLNELTGAADLSGAWDDPDCRAHHRADSPARYIHFTVSEETEVSITLTSESGGALFVSKDTPQNGWGTRPGATYEHRVSVRLNNGKLLHDGSNSVTLTLAAGETYTVEAVSTSGDGGSFTLTIEPQ